MVPLLAEGVPLLLGACAGARDYLKRDTSSPPAAIEIVAAPATAVEPAEEAPRPMGCSDDADCGYDPARDACDADPRSNRQPPLLDQGVVCYCAEHACATLRVPPVPCEFDASCAVALAPRPHPVAAPRTQRRAAGVRCADDALVATCERTNICTLKRCPSKKK